MEDLSQEELIEKVNNLEKQIAYLNLENNEFKNGGAKMYYALERKNSEIAKLLNAVKLDTIDVASKNDSSFDRIMKVIEKAEVISNASKAFGALAGITGNEQEDINKPIRKPLTAESIADSLNNSAGQKIN